jgi:hypothetical protein
MIAKNKLKKSMLDYAINSGNSDEFSPKVALTFYQIKRKSCNSSEDVPLLCSIGKDDIMINKVLGTRYEIRIKDTTAKHVSQYEFLKLCYILNEMPETILPESKRHGLYDFEAILRNKERVCINSNKALSTYVTDILGWPFFHIQKTASLSKNIWRVRSFLQTLTGVGISIVEGAHRVVLTTKLMTGMSLYEHIPFYPKPSIKAFQLPIQSPTWSKANVQVLTVANKKKTGYDENDRIIENKTLKIYQEYSENVANQKTHFIDSTWKDWIGELTIDIAEDPEIDQEFGHLAFSKLKEPQTLTGLDKYLDQHHKVVTHVATCLFDKIPASRLAETAKTYDEKNKNKQEQVVKDKFKKQVLLNKWGKYTHQYWSGVSELAKR